MGVEEFERIGLKTGTDKVSHHGYQFQYGRLIDFVKGIKGAGIFEIGLFQGASLKLWLEYFPDAFVYGMDIETEFVSERAKILKGDQARVEDLVATIKSFSHPIHLMIDDGSHDPRHQILSFSVLFQVLQPGGVYIIEDIETSYWRQGELYGNQMRYGAGHSENIVEKFKLVADYVNREFVTPVSKEAQLEKLKTAGFTAEAVKCVSSVTFSRNMIAIHKMTRVEYDSFEREYRGKQYL